MHEIKRKGAISPRLVPPAVLASLEKGEIETATLPEGLAINQARLMAACFPDIYALNADRIEAIQALGIAARMQGMGELLRAEGSKASVESAQLHPSDTVRGWACYALAASPDMPLDLRLTAFRPLADDAHFGVREWAWLALRPKLSMNISLSVQLLTPWASHQSERLRRFSCEALRPRGVWCKSIAALKENPALALPILERLKADPSPYVQDSVANWLNDAGKTQAFWVKSLCDDWLTQSPYAATERIVKRALRNL